MTDMINLTGAFGAGIFLGALFFGGLWWTTRKGLVADSPVLWFLGSLILRNGITVTGFYFVTHGDWHRALACLCGFFVARLTVLRLTATLLHQPRTENGVQRES